MILHRLSHLLEKILKSAKKISKLLFQSKGLWAFASLGKCPHHCYSWPEMVQVFLFLWSWTDRFCSVDPWFQDELDSGYNIQIFFIVGPRICCILYAKNAVCDSESCFSWNQGSTDQNWSVQDHRKRKTWTLSGLEQRKETSVRSRPKKKIKKIPDQIGPSDPRTKRSVDPCLEVLLETVLRRPELIQILRSCTEAWRAIIFH